MAHRDRRNINYKKGDFFFAFQFRTHGITTAHTHSGLELHYCYDGDGFFRAPGSAKPLVPGRITLIHAPVFHRVSAMANREYCRTVLHLPESLMSKVMRHVDLDPAPLLPSPDNPIIQVFPSARDHEDLMRVFRQIRRVLRLDHDPYSPFIVLYIAELMYIMHRMVQVSDGSFSHASPQDHFLVEQAKLAVDDRPTLDLTVDDLAALVGVSRGHLCRVFNNVLGISPRDFLVERRMEAAKSWLTQGLPVSEVASKCRYADISSFSRAFKMYVGVAPTVYAARVQN